MTKNMEIAERLKAMREMQNLTPADMAEATGITEKEYLLYEAGQSDFTFSLLYNCAKKLDLDMTELVEGKNPNLDSYSIVRAGHGMKLKRREGFEYLHVASHIKNRIAEPFVVTAPYREEEQNEEIKLGSHEGQELDFILEGSLKCNMDGHIEILHAGDCLYYDSGRPHGMIATGGDKCIFLAVVMQK